MNASRIFKLITVILMVLFVSSCALKIPPYIETKSDSTTPTTPVVSTNVYMAGLYYDGVNDVPSYWINDQRVSCDNIPSIYSSPPLIAVDESNDMFMTFGPVEGLNAGICINSTYNEFLVPDQTTDSVYRVTGIAESSGEIYVVGSIYRNQVDCTGVVYNDTGFDCATIWRSSTNYAPEFLPIDPVILPSARDINATSVSVYNGHVYVLASVSNYGGSWEVGYWLDGVFHKQTSLFSGVSNLYWVSPYQIKVINGVVYESGIYITNDSKQHFFYLKDGVLNVISAMGSPTNSVDLDGMEILNNTVYMAANIYNNSGIATAYLISGNTVTTLSPKDSTYYSTAYGLATDNSSVVYVVGTITSKTTYATKGAVWSTNADPKFYDNVAEFSSMIIK